MELMMNVVHFNSKNHRIVAAIQMKMADAFPGFFFLRLLALLSAELHRAEEQETLTPISLGNRFALLSFFFFFFFYVRVKTNMVMN